MNKPLPIIRDDSGKLIKNYTTYDWFNKLNEGLDEIKIAVWDFETNEYIDTYDEEDGSRYVGEKLQDFKTDEIKKIMYGRLFEEKKEEPKRKESAEESQVWQKLLESGKKYDGDKMANALSKARENGAMLAKSERWGYVISIENCSEASKKDYEESIKPYLMHHKEWLARMLKNFAQ